MILLSLLLPACSILLLALHFFRSGNDPVMLLALLLLVVLFVRRPWAARLLQAGLLLGAVEWVRTAISLALARIEAGEPFLRLAIILGGVSLFTACSLLVFRTVKVSGYFKLDAAPAKGEAGVGRGEESP